MFGGRVFVYVFGLVVVEKIFGLNFGGGVMGEFFVEIDDVLYV